MNEVFVTPNGTKLLLLMQHGKKYLQVQQRVIWFREELPNWGIETEAITLDDKVAVFRATIRNEQGRIMAQGTKSETPKGFGDYIEKAETGAIGRALALIGYGTQFTDEFDEGKRIVDSPVEKKRPTEEKAKDAYIVPFGKFKGINFLDISPEEATGFANWLINTAQKDKKPLSKLAQEFIDACNFYHAPKSDPIPEESDIPF